MTSVVSFNDDVMPTLSFNFKWSSGCIPVFRVQLAEVFNDSRKLSHDRLIPSVSGSDVRERVLSLSVPGTGLKHNTQYSAVLTSVSSEREIDTQGAVIFGKWYL